MSTVGLKDDGINGNDACENDDDDVKSLDGFDRDFDDDIVSQEVRLSGSGVEAREEVSSKRRFTEMSQPSHWIDLHDVRKLRSKLKAKLMSKRFEEKKVADNIVEEAIVGDTIVGDNFGISNENVVPESVLVAKANVGVEIIIVSDDDGDGDNKVVRDTMDTFMVETDDEIDSVAIGMSGFILEACVDAIEGGSLEVTPDYTPEKAVQQASLEGNMENQLSNAKQSGNVGSQQFIQTRKSQRIQSQKPSENGDM
ncbi:hypothetical protein Tco_0870892 [Tanacetum coccineum]